MKDFHPSFIIALFLGAFLCSTTSFAQTYGKNGMVVSDNVVASQVGTDILKKGGNAIDASVATAFALAVTHPQAGNIGGGGFLVYVDANGTSTTIDFREKAPLLATPTMFLDESGTLIPGSNHEGLKSVGVPGTVAGLYLAHQKYGVLPWKDLVQPSVNLAENGVLLSYTLAKHAKSFNNSSSAPQFLKEYYKKPNGELNQFGNLWIQNALANTLKLIRDKGKDGFYKGEVAKEIADYMKANGGIITLEDLSKYKAIEREAITGTYKDYGIISMPPPSSGGVAIIEMLNIMEQANLDSIPFNSTPYVHLVAETMRRAFADRAEYLGDPDFNLEMPLDRLTSKEFAKMRYDNIDRNKASVSDTLKFGQLYDGKNTTHLSVIDKQGNAVSLTYTLEQSYGSGLGSPKLGFIFNNEMGDFNPQPGYTDSGWLIGTDPNVIQPEKRMLSSMSPTVVTKNGKPYLIIGSPGGRTIINTVFQTILNVIAYDMPIDKAIEAMKIHHQWFPDKLIFETDLMSPDTQKALEQMGHQLIGTENLGRLMGILVPTDAAIYIGATDSSSPDGAAVGY
ncbi:gamma-glutamyltranspeptidase/glutathione hydrolase [Gelidibacter algens]|uniref:Glutathione hydrolase proenzyme n=1 Tax=Gelidibacter algens TaxID=49280 RepID=A0A1A7R6Q6_9FLAO|nr:gamma-glutamyltransferase [Gelidibacter algens]OBX27178.1 gamma-glutamyltransferase [Gelidibacter algens]RAJ22030.1 gamma-glutamyltranspeptidase/glutathione hydrolase [Gelidibacter algens]